MPQAMHAKISRRRNEFGEWVVRMFDSSGRRIPAADYFTDDYDDAIDAVLEVVMRAQRFGL